MDSKQRIDELVAELNRASAAYYAGRSERMSNYEWDAGFDELAALEAETGYIRPESPTQTVSAEGEQSGLKEPHEFPPLSLAKTKDVAALQAWAGERDIWLSWKLDGMTLVLTYDGGKLSKILTRGTGRVGTNISFMKQAIKGIPRKIEDKGHLVIRGEALISYSDFEQINDMTVDGGEKYANPRNLTAGTLALDIARLSEASERRVRFIAFTLVYLEAPLPSWGARMEYLDRLGFVTIAREKTSAPALPDAVERWTRKVEAGEMDLPVDGLVVCFDDTDYAASGSVTGHHETRGGIAFKWEDSSALTRLDHVEWSCAASTITPVAVFDPVELEGTIVTRASLHNISEMERLGIGADGQTTLEIIKANKIIPKCIAVHASEGSFSIPAHCPVCRESTELKISERSQVKTLHCSNADCPAKHVKRFTRFASKQGMDIDGLSVKTLLRFMNEGYLSEFADIYRLHEHAAEIETLEGFGKRSRDKLLRAIERSRAVDPMHFIYALCIPMIGIDAGKRLVAALGYPGFLEQLKSGAPFDDIPGIGPERSKAILEFFALPKNQKMLERLLAELSILEVAPQEVNTGRLAGLTVAVTGDLQRFPNRAAFKAYVEAQGGSVRGSISKKTSLLLNNDPNSASKKNETAQQLGIPILSEEEFVGRYGGA